MSGIILSSTLSFAVNINLKDEAQACVVSIYTNYEKEITSFTVYYTCDGEAHNCFKSNHNYLSKIKSEVIAAFMKEKFKFHNCDKPTTGPVECFFTREIPPKKER